MPTPIEHFYDLESRLALIINQALTVESKLQADAVWKSTSALLADLRPLFPEESSR